MPYRRGLNNSIVHREPWCLESKPAALEKPIENGYKPKNQVLDTNDAFTQFVAPAH